MEEVILQSICFKFSRGVGSEHMGRVEAEQVGFDAGNNGVKSLDRKLGLTQQPERSDLDGILVWQSLADFVIRQETSTNGNGSRNGQNGHSAEPVRTVSTTFDQSTGRPRRRVVQLGDKIIKEKKYPKKKP